MAHSRVVWAADRNDRTGASSLYVHNSACHSTEVSMKGTALIELRNHVKNYFDIAEGGSTLRVFRNGKPIADIVAIRSGAPLWQKSDTTDD